MYKKTKVREILYLLSREISASEIAETLHVSRNTIAHIRNAYEDNEMDIEELYLLDDDQMYAIFYPKKFAPRNRFVPVDYGYVHKELKRIGVNETLLWEEYRDSVLVRALNIAALLHLQVVTSDILVRKTILAI